MSKAPTTKFEVRSPTFGTLIAGDVVHSKHGMKSKVLSVKVEGEGQAAKATVVFEITNLPRCTVAKTKELMAQFGGTIETSVREAWAGVWKVIRTVPVADIVQHRGY